MKKVRNILAVVISIAMAVSLAACGSSAPAATDASIPATSTSDTSASAPSSADSAKANASGEKISLVYAGSVDPSGAKQEIVKQFCEQNPDIEVRFVEMPADQGAQHNAYVTSFAAGGKDYDIIDSNVIWPAEFSQAGYALPIEEYIEKDSFPIDEFLAGYVDAYTFKGRIWGLPNYANAGVLLYRTDIISTPPKTWDELYTMAEQSVGKEGTKYGYLYQAAQYEGLVCNAVEFMSSYGGEIVDGDGNIIINNQNVIDGLTMMAKFTQSKFVPSNITTFKENECTDSFAAGDAVFMRQWPGPYSTLQNAEKSKVAGKIGVAAMPAGPAGSVGALGGWGCMINKNTDNPDAAWKFISFRCGAEGQKINAVMGAQPPIYKPLYQDKEVLEKNPFFEMLYGAIQNAAPRPVSPVYTELSSIMQIEISKAITGQSSVRDAVAKMDTDMKAVAAK